jgi:hypothetical protein
MTAKIRPVTPNWLQWHMHDAFDVPMTTTPEISVGDLRFILEDHFGVEINLAAYFHKDAWERAERPADVRRPRDLGDGC